MNEKNDILIDVDPDVHDQFIEANKELEKVLGKAPGAAFLMGMAVERVNPHEIAEGYLEMVSERFATARR